MISSNALQLILLLIVINKFSVNTTHTQKTATVLKNELEALKQLLFPNRTQDNYSNKNSLRRLGIYKTPYDSSVGVTCTKCSDLFTCNILNGYQIQEVYYPQDPQLLETCKVLESLGERMSKEIFGNGKTFLNTVQCRDIVMQYLCLFYGSNNPMYKNYCIYQESVVYGKEQIAPRPPCKSFCVQVATTCANDPTFIQTCTEIVCPPTQDECTPDPQLNGKVLAANLGCQIPYNENPYFASSSTRIYQSFLFSLLIIVITLFII